MSRQGLLLFAANAAIVGTLVYELRTGQLAEKNLFLVAAICIFGVNGLLFFLLRRRRS
jgi:hypothetical protein